MVPRGNQYSIKNASLDDCIIFYARVKAYDAAPVARADEEKLQAKSGSKKHLQPPWLELPPKSSPQSSREPVTVVVKKGSSKKTAASLKK